MMLAGSGAARGLAIGQIELISCFVVLILGWVFVPFYIKSAIYRIPRKTLQ